MDPLQKRHRDVLTRIRTAQIREDEVSACERDWKRESSGKQMCSAEVVQFT